MKPTRPSATHILRRVYQIAAGRRLEKCWDTAWEHIKEHLRAVPDKPAHSVFAHRYRSEEAVAELIRRAANGPSRVDDSFLTIGGQPIGAPCLIIRRWFNEPIGLRDGQPVEWLTVIADGHGNLVTAFPAE